MTKNDLTRDELILKYLPRVERSVKRYIKKHPAQRYALDDLIGDCNLKLVEVVDLYFEEKIDNFGGYLHQSIMRAILAFFRTDSLMPVRSKDPPTVVFGKTGGLLAPTPPEMSYEEAFDVLLSVIKGPRDAAIFQHRWDGMTIQQTADRMGVSAQTVRRRLKRMREHYAEKAQDAIGID